MSTSGAPLVSRDEASRHLLEAAKLLWPAPSDVALAKRGRRRRGDAEYLVLSVKGRARVLVPTHAPRAAAAVMKRANDAKSHRVRLLRRVVAFAARLGFLKLAPGQRLRVAAASAETSFDRHLALVLGRPVVVSVAIGSLRANRKPVVQVLTPDGETLAFAKIAPTPLTATLVEAETVALEALAGRDLDVLVAPSILWSGTWHRHSVLVQSPLLPGAGPGAAGPPVAAMRELAHVFDTTEQPLHESRWWRTQAESIGHGPHKSRLTTLVEQVERRWGRKLVTFGASHGDWTRWNTAQRGERVYVWDWERFSLDVPLGFDLAHWIVQDALIGNRLSGWNDAVALCRANLPQLLPRVGVRPHDAPLVTVLYLLSLAIRYAREVDTATSRRLQVGLGRMLDVTAACVSA